MIFVGAATYMYIQLGPHLTFRGYMWYTGATMKYEVIWSRVDERGGTKEGRLSRVGELNALAAWMCRKLNKGDRMVIHKLIRWEPLNEPI